MPTLWSYGLSSADIRRSLYLLLLTLEAANHSLTAPAGEVVLRPPVHDPYSGLPGPGWGPLCGT